MNDKEWEDLKKRFLDHFGESRIRDQVDEISFESSSSSLSVTKSGKIQAEMPLHSFSSGSFEKIEFLEEGVRVLLEDTEYVFRK